MKSIRTKVVVAVVVLCALVGTIIGFALTVAYQKNVALVAQTTLDGARSSFTNLVEDDVDLLNTLAVSIEANDEWMGLLAARDRDGLVAEMTPAFSEMKEKYRLQGIVFFYPEGDGKIFARIHQPEVFDDVMLRPSLQKAVGSGEPGWGLESGKHAYSIRVVVPLERDGKVIGYLEVAKDITRFMEALKAQSGDEYALLLQKEFMKADVWAEMRKTQGLADNWDEDEEWVSAVTTAKEADYLGYDGTVADLPAEGKALGSITEGGDILVKSVFPVYGSNQKIIGAVVVAHDATELFTSMAANRNGAITLVGVLAIVLALTLIVILNSLVFRRIKKVINDAMRFIGGEHDREIVVLHDDEMGEIEKTLEEFRVLFKDAVDQAEVA